MWLFGLFKQGRILEKGTKRRVKKLGTAFFVLYVLVLVYLLFFSEGYGRVADAEREYRYNLVPFVEIRRFWTYRKIVVHLRFSQMFLEMCWDLCHTDLFFR